MSQQAEIKVEEPIKKEKYDGRTKKRKWEERRSENTEDSDVKREKPTEAVERIRRRKFALLMGYSGSNYYGMQRNPQTATIEEELFTALLKSEHINEENFNQVQTMQFQRAARTDKGVSAVRQVCSMKLRETLDIAKINEHLPETIRIFGARRVTKGFNSKSQCDARTYMYMLPTAAFADHDETVSQETYRLNDEKLAKINEILALFVGTKNYHNYTCRKRFNDPSAARFIMSFECDKPFITQGIEFAVMRVKGQSFMMHHIRKMVGITLSLVRGHTDMETFKKSFTNEKVNLPKAPGLGLVLDFVHYTRYDQRYGADHDKLLWEEENAEVEAFREKYIYPTIVDTEVKELSMLTWVKVLDIHGYDLDEEENNDEKDGNVSD